MGRFASALAFAFMLAVVLGSAGCGQRFDHPAGPPPTEAELASQALTALEESGSAHVVVDATGGSISGTTVPLSVHFEGDVSRSAVDGDGEVRFPGGTLGARVLVGGHDVYIRFMGVWYRAASGLDDAVAKATESGGGLPADLATPEGLGKRFGELFEGDVTQGPEVDGVATWKFDGHLSGKTLVRYSEQYGGKELSDTDRALLRKAAETSHFVLVVGRDDHLPRTIELSLDPPKDLQFDSEQVESGGPFSVKVELSNFGEDVSFTAPKDAKPLDALAEQLFGAMG
ncbi:MAG TPA: hypothetical protein VH281_04115 [Gaiellaceae bacterium]